ncbi:hypothetical protein [Duganella aceris]|uniref:3-oxoacyl-ACP synthase n=1 Tax=Duganella aceris TaxID=2703883 RepID=A0ABX0FK42_9BURK|nr:hypothetical protein [Duganella aceris]NGZ84936.1 hypothetical protein [Duganella aceris]
MIWLRNAALTTTAFGGSWGGAIWFWRENNRMPDTGDLVLYLLVLPVLLLTAWWLGRKAWTRISMPAAASASTAAAVELTPVAPALAPGLTIAASAVRAPHGASIAELRGALAGQQARPELDKELYDDDGYPIMSARLPDAGTDIAKEEFGQWLGTQALPDPHFDEGQWRALAAGGAVVSELAGQLGMHQHLQPWLEQQHERREGRLPPNAVAAAEPPALQLLAVWPAEWRPEQRDAAQQWLRHLVVESGWPQERLAPTAAPSLDPHSLDDAGQLLAALLKRAAEAQRPSLALVVAAGSQVSEAGVARLSHHAALFTSANAQGQIPGEGAAGLLLADAAQAQLLDGAGRNVLQAIVNGRRGASADTARRDTDTSLADLTGQVLREGQADAAKVALVAADTGHRTSRVMELMNLVTATAPQLDPGADVIGIGASCGSCGAVTWMTALALADAEAQDRAGPVLCISNEDPYRRCAALITPAAAA